LTTVLSVQDLRGGYGDSDILHGISLEVQAGEIVTIAGTNGSGKSTLLKGILGLLPRVFGSVVLNGQNISGLQTEERIDAGLACVPQVANVFRSLSVMENLLVSGRKVDPERITQMLDLFSALKSRLSQLAGTLSGGERQQLAFARALMAAPRLIVLDEPTAALAPALVEQIFALVVELPAQQVSVLMVEQRARQALAISDRGYILDQGRLVLSGSAQGLLDDPRMTELYLGTDHNT
jgi:ABC-type branched-subunit amino acid transport system ATPase component